MNYTGLILALLGVIGQIASAHGFNAVALIANDPNTAQTIQGVISVALILWGGAHTGLGLPANSSTSSGSDASKS